MGESNQTGTDNQQAQQTAQQNQQTQQNQQQQQQQQQTAPQVDYLKIQQMLDGALAAKEDVALKAYFKQQGMTEEEMKQAVAIFKQQKAASQPDVAAIQDQLAQAQAAAMQAEVEKAATLAAISLGVETKSIPYLIKMADLSQAAGKDGKINGEAIKAALETVLKDVPGLRPQIQSEQSTGFMQVGAVGGQKQQTNAVEAELDNIFGVKKK